MGTGRESDPLGTVVSSPTTLSVLSHQPFMRESAGGPAACSTCIRADPAAGPSSRDGGGIGDVPTAPGLAVFHLASLRSLARFLPVLVLSGGEVVVGALSVGGVR